MSKRFGFIIFTVLVVMLLTTSLRAETFKLKNGKEIVGTIQEYKDDEFKVKTDKDIITIKKDDLVSIIFAEDGVSGNTFTSWKYLFQITKPKDWFSIKEEKGSITVVNLLKHKDQRIPSVTVVIEDLTSSNVKDVIDYAAAAKVQLKIYLRIMKRFLKMILK